jgi:hypothetical protein
MNAGELKMGDAVRWDTNTNKIYFNIERWSVGGRLVLQKGADGRIDMHIVKGETPVPAGAQR